MSFAFTDLPDDILFIIYDNLEMFTIKRLQLVSKLKPSTQQYMFKNSQYRLLIDDQHTELLDLPGYPISQLLLDKNENMINHISQFRYYVITISIFKFEDTLKLLEGFIPIFSRLFESKEELGKFKFIRLYIQLHYSLNTFNDVKDCLSSIDRLSHFFNSYGGNNVQIDLELNRR